MTAIRLAQDGELFPIRASGGDWLSAWRPAGEAPDGTPHGATGLCVTPEGQVVLINQRGVQWEWPGGRPEPGGTWEETCSVVGDARLLGFCRSECLSGPEEGLVLVRSVWRGEVELLPWQARFEVRRRRLFSPEELRSNFWINEGWEPIVYRALAEAGLLVAGERDL